MYYMGFTYKEAYNLQVPYRRWFINRIAQELSKTSEQGETASKALHANTPDVRQLQGRQREQVPAKLRRFT